MSNTSYSSKENSLHMKVIQGGEKKVMKKILSVALSTAMAFSMFASVAFGADATLTPDQKFDALKTAEIVNGLPDGLAHLDKTLTRAELAKIITKSLGLKEVNGVYTYKDKNYGPNHWAAPFIEAVTSAKIMQGSVVNGKQFFNPNGNVTAQELAIVLTRAMNLEVPTTGVDNGAAVWAKGEVQAAINAGLLEANTNWTAAATRSQAIVAAYAVWEKSQLPTVSDAKVIDATHVDVTLSTGEVVKVELPTALTPNVETPIEFKDAAGNTLSTKVTYVVTTATKVDSVTATNLKEVTVTFDGTVDADTAEDVSNYSLKSGKTIDSAVLSDDEKTVTLTVTNTLANNKADALTVTGIKAGSATVSASNVEFTTVDNTLPTVDSVESLGTKSVKVVFSEPVSGLTQSNFTLDGKSFYGKVELGAKNRSAILTPYSTGALAVGDHQLTVSQVRDYANFVALAKSFDFTVVEDKDAPTVSEASATLENVTLTFSEVVDPSTISGSKVYWMSGNSKKQATAADPIRVADNKYKFTFGTGTNSLPTGPVTIYVEGVKDYSGNQIAANTSVVVNAEIDTTRPEVKKIVAVDSKTIDVTFSKELYSSTTGPIYTNSNFTVTDADGKNVIVKRATPVQDPITHLYTKVRIELYGSLSAGENTVTIKNLRDNTKLQNTMLDYTGKVNLADTEAPELDSTLVNKSERTVILGFDKQMDASTLSDYSNYNVVINGTRLPLTSDLADITVLQDSHAVAIKFVESYKGQTLNFNSLTSSSTQNVQKLYVLGVKDQAGNLLKEFTTSNNEIPVGADQTANLGTYDTDYSGYSAALTAPDTIEVKFSAGIVDAPISAFTVSGKTISDVQVDGTSTVKVILASDYGTSTSGLNVKVDLSQLTTLAGYVGGATNIKTVNVLDKVAPAIKANVSGGYTNLQVSGEDITVDFTENVVLDTIASADLLARDFVVTRYVDGKELTPGVDYSVTGITPGTATTSLKIHLKDTDSRIDDSFYTVAFKGSEYLTDVSPVKNEVTSFDATTTADKVDYAAVATVGVTGPRSIEVGTTNKTENYVAKTSDQQGEITGSTYAWSLSGTPIGVSINPTTGELTVQPSASEGTITIHVIATLPDSSTVSNDYTVSLTKEAAVPTSLNISGTNTVAIPAAGDTNETQLTATVYDQYGAEVTTPAPVIDWTIVGGAPTGVTIDSTGKVTVDEDVSAGTFTVKATSGDVSNQQVITVTP
ncbi:S-layer homology domain-containing protein [Paenibacillus physcomitrellae]|uniref:SLH domain-containing protein n=1 Tax=Paenibacillus physcomitrellae TaxID=1619311 RepID=A0ABQ1GHN2_9BACL|nr:S-layer homology domain-containing protein [Paenibacillus physcomitrellae]GGA43889.1 hypothetical protein GCM10010917_31490 [Paenibacillus physcomitrellae]